MENEESPFANYLGIITADGRGRVRKSINGSKGTFAELSWQYKRRSYFFFG
ncbi:hypothetical protein [Parageobacillus sp. KH3-4]|uniref:hypothetical protein n=1 Tax=Parageobacillus sp. KH3-4 TaxID=2916802 RepID=UPI001FCBCC4F|nr:hypothetical protein [Parageobacillus sp. KH3-4]